VVFDLFGFFVIPNGFLTCPPNSQSVAPHVTNNISLCPILFALGSIIVTYKNKGGDHYIYISIVMIFEISYYTHFQIFD